MLNNAARQSSTASSHTVWGNKVSKKDLQKRIRHTFPEFYTNQRHKLMQNNIYQEVYHTFLESYSIFKKCIVEW